LSTEEAAAQVIATSYELFGRRPFDTLVLNHIIGFFDEWAGVWQNTTKKTATEQVFGQSSPLLQRSVVPIVNINALSYVYLATHAIPVLSASHGNLVVVSSAAARLGLPLVSIYSATKHFLDGFFRSLRHDLRRHPETAAITISMVYLGNIDTPNAVANTRGLLDHLPRAQAADAAAAVMRTGQCRLREAFFPWLEVRPVTLLYPFFGDWLDIAIEHTMPSAN
jgi:NAD(P)-dependent dehydrogenase (short-subunit alcohol dehydrogenase family)